MWNTPNLDIGRSLGRSVKIRNSGPFLSRESPAGAIQALSYSSRVGWQGTGAPYQGPPPSGVPGGRTVLNKPAPQPTVPLVCGARGALGRVRSAFQYFSFPNTDRWPHNSRPDRGACCAAWAQTRN